MRGLVPGHLSKHTAMSGPSYQQYHDVFCYLKLQATQEKQALFGPEIHLLRSRKTVAKQVGKCSQSGGWKM